MTSLPMVTLVTPCFNTANYLPRLLNSVLSQSYPRIEMITVNDGSTDETKAVIARFIPLFQKRGFSLKYIEQDNQGQSSAIQNTFSFIQGKYFAWPDSDDFYSSNLAIEKMVRVLENASGDFAIVRVQKRKVEDGSFKTVEIQGLTAHQKESYSLFYDCLWERNNWYHCSGGYLINFDIFKQLTGLKICTCKQAGQNWQLLLPMLYHYRCLSIQEPLYTVVMRKDSHCRIQRGLLSRIWRQLVFEHVLVSTVKAINGMPIIEKLGLVLKIRFSYLLMRFKSLFRIARRIILR